MLSHKRRHESFRPGLEQLETRDLLSGMNITSLMGLKPTSTASLGNGQVQVSWGNKGGMVLTGTQADVNTFVGLLNDAATYAPFKNELKQILADTNPAHQIKPTLVDGHKGDWIVDSLGAGQQIDMKQLLDNQLDPKTVPPGVQNITRTEDVIHIITEYHRYFAIRPNYLPNKGSSPAVQAAANKAGKAAGQYAVKFENGYRQAIGQSPIESSGYVHDAFEPYSYKYTFKNGQTETIEYNPVTGQVINVDPLPKPTSPAKPANGTPSKTTPANSTSSNSTSSNSTPSNTTSNSTPSNTTSSNSTPSNAAPSTPVQSTIPPPPPSLADLDALDAAIRLTYNTIQAPWLAELFGQGQDGTDLSDAPPQGSTGAYADAWGEIVHARRLLTEAMNDLTATQTATGEQQTELSVQAKLLEQQAQPLVIAAQQEWGSLYYANM
jgi:hypothetical protein